MPRSKKQDEEDLEDLVDDLDDLDEDEDVAEEDEDVEDEDVDLDEDEEDEDPDEAPKKRRTKRTPKAKAEKSGIGTKEIADELGVTPRELRMSLRALEIQPRDDREGRYHWKSLNDPEVKRIMKAVREAQAKRETKEKTDEAKGKAPAKKTVARKKTTARRARAAAK